MIVVGGWLVGFFCCFVYLGFFGGALYSYLKLNRHTVHFQRLLSLYSFSYWTGTCSSHKLIFLFFHLSRNSLHKEQEHTWARVVSLQAFLASWNKKWNKLNWKGNTEHQLRGSKGKVTLELNSNTLKATQHQQLTCQYSFCHPNLFIGQGI